MDNTINTESERTCFFCKKPRNEVKVLIVPAQESNIGICNGCIQLCIDFLFQKRADEVKKSIEIKETYGTEALNGEKQSSPPGFG